MYTHMWLSFIKSFIFYIYVVGWKCLYVVVQPLKSPSFLLIDGWIWIMCGIIAERDKLVCSDKTLIKCYFLYHKTHIDCPGSLFHADFQIPTLYWKRRGGTHFFIFARSVKFDVLSFIVVVTSFSLLIEKIQGIRPVVWFSWVHFLLNLKMNFNSKFTSRSNRNTRIVRQINSHLETLGVPSVFSTPKQILRLVPVLKSAIVVSTVQKSMMGTWRQNVWDQDRSEIGVKCLCLIDIRLV
jgi:hypothetical protein